MRRDDVRFAAAARDDGIRKIVKVSWLAGLGGVLGSFVIALAFGMHAHAQSAGSGSSGSGSGGGSISVPAQPPAPGQGPSRVRSGGS